MARVPQLACRALFVGTRAISHHREILTCPLIPAFRKSSWKAQENQDSNGCCHHKHTNTHPDARHGNTWLLLPAPLRIAAGGGAGSVLSRHWRLCGRRNGTLRDGHGFVLQRGHSGSKEFITTYHRVIHTKCLLPLIPHCLNVTSMHVGLGGFVHDL